MRSVLGNAMLRPSSRVDIVKAAHRFRRETKIVNTSLHGIVSDRENRGTDLRETKESQVVIILRIAVLSVPGLLPPDHVHLALRLRDKHVPSEIHMHRQQKSLSQTCKGWADDCRVGAKQTDPSKHTFTIQDEV